MKTKRRSRRRTPIRQGICPGCRKSVGNKGHRLFNVDTDTPLGGSFHRDCLARWDPVLYRLMPGGGHYSHAMTGHEIRKATWTRGQPSRLQIFLDEPKLPRSVKDAAAKRKDEQRKRTPPMFAWEKHPDLAAAHVMLCNGVKVIVVKKTPVRRGKAVSWGVYRYRVAINPCGEKLTECKLLREAKATAEEQWFGRWRK